MVDWIVGIGSPMMEFSMKLQHRLVAPTMREYVDNQTELFVKKKPTGKPENPFVPCETIARSRMFQAGERASENPRLRTRTASIPVTAFAQKVVVRSI